MARGDTGQGYVEEIIDAANAGDTSGFTAKDWQIISNNPGYETQRARSAREMEERRQAGTPFPSDPSGSNFNDGGGNDVAPYDPDAFARSQAAEAESRRVANVIAVINGMMTEFGLGDLMGYITGLVQQGLDGDAVMVKVRNTEQYARRFPAMAALRAKGRAITEAEYIGFERNAASLERAYGLPAGMLGQDIVTKMLENEVSGRELEERVTMAAVNAYQTSDQIKSQFQDYYGIGPGGLAAYFLDPDRALPLLNKQYASAVIGSEGAMQGIGVGVQRAEQLTDFGITREQAREGFGRARQQRGLTTGRGDVVSQDQLIDANLMQQESSQDAVARAALSRVGRFQAGGGYQTQQSGVRALESSSGY